MMTDNRDFCDCYHLNYHTDEYIPYPCDFCEKMERIYRDKEIEENDEKYSLVEPHLAANF